MKQLAQLVMFTSQGLTWMDSCLDLMCTFDRSLEPPSKDLDPFNRAIRMQGLIKNWILTRTQLPPGTNEAPKGKGAKTLA